MSSIAQGARLLGRPRARRRARTVERPRLLAGGVLWIVLFASLLAGVVAVNVAVLRLNLDLDRASRERSQLEADLAQIRAELSSAGATVQVERVAREELGLVLADPETTVVVELQPR
jgi:cell division protein FtsL